MRDMINRHKTVRDMDYCVRVTSNEGEIGRQYLERFQDNSKTIPAIVTSSQMLTTGVDAKNVRHIVLLRTIDSMTEFKQIIGRGTRVFDGKDYFTIIDFTGATNLFYDPAWDGDQVVDAPSNPPDKKHITDPIDDLPGDQGWVEETPPPLQKLRVKLANHKEIRVINIETRYIDESGKPLSGMEYIQSLIGKLPAFFQSEEQLRTIRADPKTREDLLRQLETIGLDQEQFATLQAMFEAPDSDVFDILTHLSYGEDLRTRRESTRRVRDHGLTLKAIHNLTAREFLEYVLQYYEQYGSTQLVQSKMSDIIKLYGRGKMSVVDMSWMFGGVEKLMQAWKQVQKELFIV